MIRRYYYEPHGNIIEKDDSDKDFDQWVAIQDHLIGCEVTEEEYNELLPKLERAKIQRQRRARYEEELPDGDQLDVLWKALEAVAAGGELPAEAIEVLATRRKIKKELPYILTGE
jgi:hypothetical protein